MEIFIIAHKSFFMEIFIIAQKVSL
jgi:hypothetical protein